MQLFCNAKREAIKAANPEASFAELSKLLAVAWKEASDADKQPFQTMHEVPSLPSHAVHLLKSCSPRIEHLSTSQLQTD